MGQGNIRSAELSPHFFRRFRSSHTLLRQRSMAFVVPEGQAASRGDVGKVPQKQVLKV
jgi:hypothetical protein